MTTKKVSAEQEKDSRILKAVKLNERLSYSEYAAAATHVSMALRTMGFDMTDENFRDTPQRWIKYLAEFSHQYTKEDYERILAVEFSTKHREFHGMSIERNVPYRGVCAHHLLPFFGVVHIGYIPHKKVPGLSKIPRLVDAIGTSNPSIQEHHTDEIADILEEVLEPRGVMVVTASTHTCMSCRGVRVPGTDAVMSTLRGVFRDVPSARQEFLSLVNLGK